MFIEIYKSISEKKRAARLKKSQSFPVDTQETQNLTQTANRLQSSGVIAQNRQDSINQEENKSIERVYFLSENNQKRNLVTSDFHMEPSQALE